MGYSLSDALLEQLSDRLAARIGLHFPRDRWADLERGMASAAPDLGFAGAEPCVRGLLSADWNRAQIEILAGHLTIGETYFFREPRSFEVLSEVVLPKIVYDRRQHFKYLRLWSAACCTGEEAYSLSIVLDRLIPDIADWNITILATDINPRFLRRAVEGVYSEWSFRGLDPAIRDAYFVRHTGNTFKVVPRLRNRITFAYLNLVEDTYPSFANNTNAMDIILCRNVMMYFDRERAAQVVDRLHRSLVDDGWLLPSPVDGSPALFANFETRNFGGTIFYHRTEPLPPETATAQEGSEAEIAPLPGAAALSRREEAEEAFARGRYAEASAVFLQHLEHRPDDTAAMFLLARSYAGQGQLAEALTWCGKAVEGDRMAAANHYLLGVIQQECGDHDAAVKALRRALFLDPHLVLAHFALANLVAAQGQAAEARKHYRNTLALIEGHPAEEVLLAPEGITVGQVRAVIRHADVLEQK